MKNAFYFTSKALFVLKIFKFLSWFFGHVAKFYDVTTCLTIVIQILPNVSRIRDNQTMKFVQLIECNMGNVFPEKSYTICGE